MGLGKSSVIFNAKLAITTKNTTSTNDLVPATLMPTKIEYNSTLVNGYWESIVSLRAEFGCQALNNVDQYNYLFHASDLSLSSLFTGYVSTTFLSGSCFCVHVSVKRRLASKADTTFLTNRCIQ